MPEQSQGEQYQNIQKKYSAFKTANKINAQQSELRKRINSGVSVYSDNLDNKEASYKAKYESFLSGTKNNVKNFQNQGKTQIDSLIDLAINSISNNGDSNTLNEIKQLFIRTIRTTRGRIQNILQDEIISSLGCSQEQEFKSETLYIPVSSIDIFGNMLQYSPAEKPGQYLYENLDFNPFVIPYSFNRELHNRIQKKGVSYLDEYNTLFRGKTNQNLFNITYVTKDNNNVDGDFFKVELQPRFNGNKVVEFLGDYYLTIDVVNIKEVYTNVLNALTGVISINKKFADNQSREQFKWEILIQRLLGMCFDNKQEIDVSGVGKLDQLDQADTNLISLNDIDNLEIEQKVKNFNEGVIEFSDCANIKLNVNNSLILNLLNPFNDQNLITNDPDFLAENMINSLSNNPEWKAKIQTGLDVTINKEFLKVVILSVVNTILSPKHIFPFIVMQKALKPNELSADSIDGFVRTNKKFLMNIVSKISAIFVEELVKEIKKNYKRIVNDLVNQQLNEILIKKKKNVKAILDGINIGLSIIQGIEDYRRCQNVIDELQRLLSLSQRLLRLTTGGNNPLWNTLASVKPGMSTTSLLTRYIEELEKNGVDTGDMPDGSPNTGILVQRSIYQTIIDEVAENGKVSVGISSLDVAALSTGTKPIINLFGNLE